MSAIRDMARKVRHFSKQGLLACGVDFYIRSDDRRVLETVILPYFATGPEWRKVLFVGCEWYTRGYRKLFTHQDYWTLEIDPSKARFGSRKHLVDGFENVRAHFAPGVLDLIVCNGVFGWGLNERADVEQAFGGAYDCLREGGILIVGWNDLLEHLPFPLVECAALQRFVPWVFPPLRSAEFLTESSRHTYAFYRKGLSGAAS